MNRMRQGDLVVAGHRLIKHVDKIYCEHLAEVEGSMIETTAVEFAGFVAVWRMKNIPDGAGKPAGAGLMLWKRPIDQTLIDIYQEIANAAGALQLFGSDNSVSLARRLGDAIHRLHVYATTDSNV